MNWRKQRLFDLPCLFVGKDYSLIGGAPVANFLEDFSASLFAREWRMR